MPRFTNTKERIIESAFSLYERPRLKEISLSEIAQATGVSKTAIFRHYTNKDELVVEMRNSFISEFEKMVGQFAAISVPIGLKDVRGIVDCVFDFDAKNPNYLNYFMQVCFADKKLMEGVDAVLVKNKISAVHEHIFKDEKNLIPRNLVSSFFEMTMMNFLLFKNCDLHEKKISVDPSSYREGVSKIIYSGMGKRKNPISPERLKELDSLCAVEIQENETQNRFLEAFTKVLKECNNSKVTVEKIADALGIAKSTIYSFFNSKIDFVQNMLFQETERISGLLDEKCAAAKNAEEALYILMRTEANYFSKRQQVLMLHAFFAFRGLPVTDDMFQGIKAEFADKIVPENFFGTMEEGQRKSCFIRWVSGLTVSFMTMGERYKFPPSWSDFYIPAIFEFIECGIKFCKSDGE